MDHTGSTFVMLERNRFRKVGAAVGFWQAGIFRLICETTIEFSRTDGAYPIQRTPTCKQDHTTHCFLWVLPW